MYRVLGGLMRKIAYFGVFCLCVYVFHRIVIYTEYPQAPLVHSRRAIVVGATSGMGHQVAKLLAKDGYKLGLVGRREHLLQTLKEEIGSECHWKKIDVSRTEETIAGLEELIADLGGLDLMFISVSALGDLKKTKSRSWDDLAKLIDVDAKGFWICARVALKHFEEQNHGHLVAISSIDSQIGSVYSPEYSGAKAFVARFLDGTRNRMIRNQKPIFVTEIIPGPVDVERCLYSKMSDMYWVATKEVAANQIFDAIKSKAERAYITKRWKIMSLIFSYAPDWVYRRIE